MNDTGPGWLLILLGAACAAGARLWWNYVVPYNRKVYTRAMFGKPGRFEKPSWIRGERINRIFGAIFLAIMSALLVANGLWVYIR